MYDMCNIHNLDRRSVRVCQCHCHREIVWQTPKGVSMMQRRDFLSPNSLN